MEDAGAPSKPLCESCKVEPALHGNERCAECAKLAAFRQTMVVPQPTSSFPALRGVPPPPSAPAPYRCPVVGRVPGGGPCGDTDPYEWTTMKKYGDRAWVQMCVKCRTWIRKNEEAAQVAFAMAGRARTEHGDDAPLAPGFRQMTALEKIVAYKKIVDEYTAKEIAPIAQEIVAEIPVGVLVGPEVRGRLPNNGDIEGAILQEACLIREVRHQLIKREWFPAGGRNLLPEGDV